MKIHVTQKHIDEGMREHCGNNPIAKAIKEATKSDEVFVGHYGIGYGKRERGYFKHVIPITPPAIREFMDRFDEGLPVAPFTFELEAA